MRSCYNLRRLRRAQKHSSSLLLCKNSKAFLMAQLSHIKNRIQTIQKTQKITKAMRMIAMSFYSKLERQRSLLNSYRETTHALSSLLFDGRATIPPSCIPPRKATKPQALIIVCTSTKGLCGGLNNNLIRFFERSLISNKGSHRVFMPIGNKACNYLRNSCHGTVIEEVPEYHFNTIEKIAQSIVGHIMARSQAYTSVTLFYTHLKNFFIQVPTQETLLPLPEAPANTGRTAPLKNQERYLWEQDPAALGSALMRQHLYTEIVFALFNSLISENAARFIAMDQSTNNAHKYLDALNLAYNKSRQNIITREIAELSSTL